jgi:hypothetical protein
LACRQSRSSVQDKDHRPELPNIKYERRRCSPQSQRMVLASCRIPSLVIHSTSIFTPQQEVLTELSLSYYPVFFSLLWKFSSLTTLKIVFAEIHLRKNDCSGYYGIITLRSIRSALHSHNSVALQVCLL